MAQVLDAPVPAQGPPATGGGEQLHYSISDAAALLGVSRTTLWRRIRDGQLRVWRLGHRTVRIRREDLEQLGCHESAAGACLEMVTSTDRVLMPENTRALKAPSVGGAAARSPATLPRVPSQESSPGGVDLREQLRTIAELQQQAQTLQANLIQRLQSEERLHRLQEITGQLSQSLEANQVLASIARSAADLLVVPVGAVFLLERGRPDGDFVLAAAYGIDEQQALNLRLPRWASLAGRAVDSGQTLVVDDARTTPGTALPALLTGETTGSEIAAPIRSGAKTFGVIKAFCATVRRFQPNDAALLTTLAAAAAVALTNAELYREAQDAIRLRDEFLSATTHDLRTPLTSLKGTAQLMRRRLTRNGQPVPDWLLEGLVSIDTTATQMGEELDDLLDVTRLQLGQPLELHRSPIDGIQLVRQVVAAQLRLSPRHQLRVETALAELIGEWDGVRLRRVLDNLLSNAIKYSPAGGPVLVTVAREQIDGGAYAVLAVQDHGVGIPAADLSHIFERFHRASNVQGRISGTGIGLASARQIVEQHGGDLTVRSTEGQGSVFTVLLPLAPTPAELRPAGQA